MKIKRTALLLAALIMSMFAVAVHAGAAAVDGAFASLENNGTLTLTEPSTLDDTVTIDGKKVTLDLNGQTLTVNNGGILVDNGAELTITDSAGNGMIDFAGKPIVIKEYDLDAGGWIYADHASTVIVEKGKILTSGTVDFSDISNATHGTPFTILGNDSSTVTVNGGEFGIACITDNCYPGALGVTNSSTLNFNNGRIYVALENAEEYWAAGVSARLSTMNINGGSIEGLALSASIVNGGELNVTGGEINSPYIGISAQDFVTVNITGGTVTGDILAIDFFNAQVNIDKNAAINGGIHMFANGSYENTLNILSGTISGEIICEYQSDNDGTNKVTISGGEFSIEPDASYLAEGMTAEYVNGSYVIKDAAGSVTVTTENTYSADGADTSAATGFVTTIKGKVTINSVRWAVTHNGETRYTDFTPEAPIAIDGEGEAKIGLVVDGFNDSAATAEATIS